MNAAYFKAAIPEPFRILGLPLKPLSLGRYRLLKRSNVAFVAEEEASATAADLVLGVLICSQRVDDFLAWYDTPNFAKDVGKWGKKVAGKWVRSKDVPNLVLRMQMFQSYIRDHSVMPKYWDESGQERSSGSHWSHSVEVALRSELGWSREEINEEPLSKALSDYFKFAEQQGVLRIMTDGEVAQGEENARIMEQLLKAVN